MPRTNTRHLNTGKGVFKDASLRATARAAIDAEWIVNDVYEGRADVAEGLLGPALPWAAELRRHIGHGRAGKPTGQTVTIGTFTDRAELPEVAAALQQHLRKAVFKANPEVREYATIESVALAGVFDAPILSRATVLDSGGPAACLYSDFASDSSFNIPQLVEGRIVSPSQRPRSRGAGPP
ncbi:ABC-type transport system substrate-binding protein [Streptomyces canus]|uniref:ABC-type transport system substrate-binding protein n=1 Tax=Streptomyces canus TaxID=58343 RepID=A0AAW8FEF0_9ACTN|nr:ABC transporter substrate-binding protein [Streptomyces canus]MDQ0907435.1 ABC-type transport system substrate-binding protein [Streptomyces canus]